MGIRINLRGDPNIKSKISECAGKVPRNKSLFGFAKINAYPESRFWVTVKIFTGMVISTYGPRFGGESTVGVFDPP